MKPAETSALSRRSLVGATVAAAGLGLTGCVKIDQKYWFRIDFGLLINGRLNSGQTTRLTASVTYPEWMLSSNPGHTEIHGSALPMEIGEGRTLYLTNYGYGTWTAGNRFGPIGQGERKLRGQWEPHQLFIDRGLPIPDTYNGRSPGLGAATPLSPQELPAIVIFSDRLAPETGKLVRPENLTSEFPDLALAPSRLTWLERGEITKPDLGLPWLDQAPLPSRLPMLGLDNYMNVRTMFDTSSPAKRKQG